MDKEEEEEEEEEEEGVEVEKGGEERDQEEKPAAVYGRKRYHATPAGSKSRVLCTEENGTMLDP